VKDFQQGESEGSLGVFVLKKVRTNESWTLPILKWQIFSAN